MSDSIDADLLDYYQRELTWLRHAGGAFAERYPKVARRLQLAPGECPDPHVERLLEGFSLLTARLQRRLDDDYAEFSDALLEQLYPLALRPLPSCAIVQFEPDPTQGNLAEGYRLPRDTALFVTTRGGDSVHFRSSAEATLWPLAIDEANLLGGEEAQALTGVGAARSALRLSLRCLGEYRWDELSIERLPRQVPLLRPATVRRARRRTDALPVPGLRSRTDGTPAFAGGRLPARLRAGDQPLSADLGAAAPGRHPQRVPPGRRQSPREQRGNP